jgi:hypothetical protein
MICGFENVGEELVLCLAWIMSGNCGPSSIDHVGRVGLVFLQEGDMKLHELYL